jgi:rhamnogalacturonan hydrolase
MSITLLSFLAISLFGFAQAAPTSSPTTCNVLSYGGVADNKTDVGPAILKAYNDCILPLESQSISSAVLLIPSGNFLLNSNVLIDHASYMTFTVTGNIYLPFNASLEGNMIMFEVGSIDVYKSELWIKYLMNIPALELHSFQWERGYFR